MSILSALGGAVAWALALLAALPSAYLLLLTLLAFLGRRRTPLPREAKTRFVVLIPAHDEELLLPELLHSLRRADYPAELLRVHVVADNCGDRTAELARGAGASVHERSDTERRGKGYALQWALERIHASGEAHDALVVLDADSLVAPDFLRVIDARMQAGARAVQAYYAVRAPERSWSTALRAVALAAVHYLRPQGRMVFGGSAGLKGNGMAFAADIPRRFAWTNALAEDIELHMALLLRGERVVFAPDAQVWAEMPAGLGAARQQHARWERGRLEMARRYAPALLRAGLRQRSVAALDAIWELLIPPFSALAALTLLALAACLALGGPAWLAAASLAAQAAYTFAALLLVRAPLALYRALLCAPLLVVWKLWLYARVLLGLDRVGWLRTRRNAEQ